MKLSSIVLVFAAGLVAIAVGWFYQSQTSTSATKPELQIPVDIDYFLSQVKFRVMAKSGKLDYELHSPYLQHFKREDISLLETPEMEIYRNQEHWQIKAKSAEMYHQQNTLNLIENVVMVKQGEDPIRLSAQRMQYESDLDLVSFDQAVELQSKNTHINAGRAIFDLNKNIYQLTNTKAVYSHEKS